ncbi:YfiT family bacillithiol transferase [Deinococcus piscis]|uniref:YfiT family bacillithiol transferase n=1 Tax=Deinococcus piscis TaxID=394230 RepID=UPI001671B4A5|nr:bacillithiol transferase BstA [Deinococcus piscis]
MNTGQRIDPRFPIGPAPQNLLPSAEQRAAAVQALAAQPATLAQVVAGLNEAQLDTPYREGGWTVRQVVHHVADSHLNAYMRTKLALTEPCPVIKPYDETRWAELPDSRLPVQVSLELLTPVHQRWVHLLAGLDEQAWQRPYVHPADGPRTVEQLLTLYVWHGAHHTAQITALRERRGW